MKIKVLRNETSNPIVYEAAIDAYTKGNMYCVLFVDKEGNRVVHKYPMCSLFRVEEEYPEGNRK